MKTLLAILVSIAALLGLHPKLGGTTTVQVTPSVIVGVPLYDTPSGNLDVGFYEMLPGGPRAHLGKTVTGTTTLPDGYYPVIQGTQATVIGKQYVFYDANRKVIGTSTDQSITTKLQTKDAPLPTIGVVQ